VAQDKVTVPATVGTAALAIAIAAFTIAATTATVTSSSWFNILLVSGGVMAALSLYALVGVLVFGAPFPATPTRPVWRRRRGRLLVQKPEVVTEDDLVVRSRGSQFVTELTFKTFARPGIRQILSRGEQRTPARLDIMRPQTLSIRSSDLPYTVSGGHGDLVVTSIVPGGFLVNEEESAGEEIVVFLYF
jgi:hypothetical protein